MAPALARLTLASIDAGERAHDLALDLVPPARQEPTRWAQVKVEGVSHWFISNDRPSIVLRDINFEVPDDQFVAVVGASGCGKTTILNMIAGMVLPARGRIDVTVKGRPVRLPNVDIGYMWARDALFPWRTLIRNVEFGLELRGIGREERRERALRMLALVGLQDHARRYARQLSQGMRQRGNLARLLATDPEMFLMDEPFAAVDAQTKHALQKEFSKIWEAAPRIVIYVTHDLNEAALLADRILVMAKAEITHDLTVPFDRPRDLDELRFDADFQSFTRELWHLLGSRR